MRISLILIFVALCAIAQETPPRDPRRVTALPAACSVGQTVFLTTGTTGTYECRTTNTWSRVADGGSASSATNIGGGSAGQFPYQTGAGATGFRSPNVANGPAVLDGNGTLPVGATVLGICGGVDDYTAVQALIGSGGKHVVLGPTGGSCLFGTGLVLPSNTHLEFAKGVTWGWKGGVSSGILITNQGYTAVRSVSDAAISSTVNTTTLTSATANFTSADVGRSVVVAGAWDLGATFPLTAKIVSRTNSTTVVLDTPAYTTVTGAALSIFNRDTNIEISGGTMVGGTWGAGSTAGNNVVLRHADGVYIHDAMLTSTGGGYAINPGDVTNGVYERLTCRMDSDCWHLQGPASQQTVRDVDSAGSSVTADDNIAITANDWPADRDTCGPVSDVLIENVKGYSSTSVVAMLGGTVHSTLRNITVRKVRSTNEAAYAVNLREDSSGSSFSGGTTDSDGIVLAEVDGLIALSHKQGHTVTIPNYRFSPSGTTAGIVAQAGAVWDNIVATNPIGTFTAAGGGMFSFAGTVGNFQVSNANMKCADRNPIFLHVVGTLSHYQFANTHLTKCADLLVADLGSTVGKGEATDTFVDGTERIADIASPVDLALTGATVNTNNLAFALATGGTLTLRGSGFVNVSGQTSHVFRSASQVVHCLNPDFPVDISILTRSAGDRCYNAVAASGPYGGTGLVIADDTQWKLATLPTLPTDPLTAKYTNGLVFYWPVSNGAGVTVSDQTSAGYNGTAVGTVTWTTLGQPYRSALTFGSSNTRAVSVASNAAFSGIAAITLSAWASTAMAPSATAVLAGKHSGGTNGEYFIAFLDTNQLRFTVTNSTPTRVNCDLSTGSVNPADGAMHHYALTYNGTLIHGYMDGVDLGSCGQTGTINAYSAQPFAVAAFSDLSTTSWTGKVTKVGIWNRALSAAEVTGLYTQFAGI